MDPVTNKLVLVTEASGARASAAIRVPDHQDVAPLPSVSLAPVRCQGVSALLPLVEDLIAELVPLAQRPQQRLEEVSKWMTSVVA